MNTSTHSSAETPPGSAFGLPISSEREFHLLKYMAEMSSDFIATCDLEMKPTYINPSGLEKLGLHQIPVKDLHVNDFFFEEERGTIINAFFPKVIRDGVGEIEVRFKHFITGEAIWMLYHVIVLYNSNGERTGFGTISRDITKHKLNEKAIIESEERFRSLAESAPMFIWMVDEHARITYANRQLLDFLSISHYTEVAVQGGWERVTHPDDIQQVYAAFSEGLAKRKPYEVEARLYNTKAQRYEWFMFKATPKFIAANVFAGFTGSAVSIQRQKALIEGQEQLVAERTQELRAANKMLERSNLELEQFAYVASHDLQEPLRKIQTFSAILMDRFSDHLDGKEITYLHKICASASRMSELMKDLLDYARLSANQTLFKKVDLNHVLKQVLDDFEVLIAQKNIIVEAQTLPVIECVPFQMNQLFYNLIGNAIKFTKKRLPGYIKIGVRFLAEAEVAANNRLQKDNSYFEISFQDNGIGFSQEYAERIFTIFQRLNDRSSYGGYGIGLALCRKIVENHKGLIYATGEENEGATFLVTLPVTQK